MPDKSPKHIVIDNRFRRSSTGRYGDRLVEHLQDVDKLNRYTVLVQPDDPWQPHAKNFARADCPFRQFSFNPMDQINFPRLLRSLRPDLVHFPMNQQPVFYRGKVVTSTLDMTMLHFTRAGKTPLPIFWLKMAGYRFLFWHSNKKSAAIITISKFVRDELAQKYPFTKHKTTVTYCAAEPPLKDKAVQPKGIDQPFIMYVGTAFPHKNLQALVQAFEAVHEDRPKLHLVLTGKKEYHYQQLEKMVRKSPAKKAIHITGFLPDASTKWMYQHAEAYVFPSLSEGFGLPGLEAMVHSCPVLSSNATCLPEVYGDAAYYFDPMESGDIANKIIDILDDRQLRADLIKKGKAQAAKYSWRRMAEETLQVYQQVLKR